MAHNWFIDTGVQCQVRVFDADPLARFLGATEESQARAWTRPSGIAVMFSSP